MSKTNIQLSDLKNIFIQETPLIDVRAPVEFSQGSLPGAVNLPILNDSERAQIGLTYKQQGQEAAVSLGYQLISGSLKEERVQQWLAFVQRHPNAVLYCFRGGKRSQITQKWLEEAGVHRPLIVGGYKATRKFLTNELDRFAIDRQFIVLSGPTGSGKTQLLKDVETFYPSLDLEALANHRGSAFGAMGEPQPAQSDFENRLAAKMLKIEAQESKGFQPVVEDESRMIGRIYQPASFFEKLRSSEVVWVDEPLPERTANIFAGYIVNTAIGTAHEPIFRCAEELDILRSQALEVFNRYRRSVVTISKKLGGLRTQEILEDLDFSQQEFLNKNEIESNKIWIEKLLRYYYDPLYLGSLERRQVCVRFRGSAKDVFEFFKNLKR